jgi:flagellar hook-associated protein 2
MANNIMSNGIYNHFLTSYASNDITKADSHKKDELKDIYKSIVRINKDSPLYLLKQDSVNEETAIAFKESARKLQGDLAMLKVTATVVILITKSHFHPIQKRYPLPI